MVVVVVVSVTLQLTRVWHASYCYVMWLLLLIIYSLAAYCDVIGYDIIFRLIH